MCKVALCTQLLRGRAGLGPRGVCTPWSSAASSSVFSERRLSGQAGLGFLSLSSSAQGRPRGWSCGDL